MTKTNNMKKNFKSASNKRHELISLSKSLKLAAMMGNLGGMSPDTPTNILLKWYYAQKGHTELKTYDEWRESGYQVKRGESALVVWSSKKKMSYNKKDENGNETEEKEEYEAFAMCNLFSQLQVEVIQRNSKSPAERKEMASIPIPQQNLSQKDQAELDEIGYFVDFSLSPEEALAI